MGKLGSDVAVNLNGGGGDDEGICILMRGSGRVAVASEGDTV